MILDDLVIQRMPTPQEQFDTLMKEVRSFEGKEANESTYSDIYRNVGLMAMLIRNHPGEIIYDENLFPPELTMYTRFKPVESIVFTGTIDVFKTEDF